MEAERAVVRRIWRGWDRLVTWDVVALRDLVLVP